jgi:UDP-2,3-diacylglucosamine pyrophosphatase LpxH
MHSRSAHSHTDLDSGDRPAPGADRLLHGHVVSDLHLFAQRSVGDMFLSAMENGARGADFFVLNGDIFDFQWTTLGSVRHSMERAAGWIHELIDSAPRCRFHYVMGNHDALAPFAETLEHLAGEHPNFFFHDSYVKIGTNLFLHGDLPLCHTPPRLDRHDYMADVRRRGRFLNQAYRLFVASRLHRRVERFIKRDKCALRICTALRAMPPDQRREVTDIFFGHTHTPFTDFRLNGLRFHNTGSAIRHLDLSMLRVQSDVHPDTAE